MRKILVLGDGQLGLMLAQAASRLGIVLDRLSLENGCLYHGTGRTAQPLAPDWCASEYELITVEHEHLHHCDMLDRLLQHPGFLNAQVIATVADRQTQKILLDHLGIPTSPWCAPRNALDIERFRYSHGGTVVVKSTRGGYDGRGQWRITDARSPLPSAEYYGRLTAERAVPFERELSLIGARTADGRTAFYPLVENHHDRGMLRCTVAPAPASATLQARAESMLSAIMNACGYVGVMAMELFDVCGDLLVNELAPRVHNSGHWSQAGALTDQFELHLRALCGWPLAMPTVQGITVMLNLVGIPFDTALLAQPDIQLHWYGKEPRAERKLGHLNIHGRDAAQLGALLCPLAGALDPAHRIALVSARSILERYAAGIPRIPRQAP